MASDTYLTISQIGMALGVILTGAAGFGAFWFGKQVDREKDTQIADLRKQVEDTKSATLSVERRISARELSATQAQAFVSSLGAARGATVVLHSVRGDQEAFRFAGLLREGLLSAGWRVRGINRSAFQQPLGPLTIIVRVKPVPEYAGVLQESLAAAGLDVVVFQGWPGISIGEGPLDPDPMPGEVHLVIGSKAD